MSVRFYIPIYLCVCVILFEVLVVSWLLSKEVDTENRVQIQDDAVCISNSADTLRKGMNSTIPPLAMSK